MSRMPAALGMVGVLLMAAACSTSKRQAADEPAVMPLSATRHGASQAEAQYALGRYYQGQLRYDQAAEAYRQVLEVKPDHADALSALGVVYAMQGRHGLAEAQLRRAVSHAPGAAHIYNNLGYALVLQGRHAEAIPAFQEALRLDPGQARAADNLRSAMARLVGRPDSLPVTASPVQAVEVESRPLPPLPSPTPAPRRAKENVRLENAVPANTQPREPGGNPSIVTTIAGARTGRLEVANGNGVGGLARRTSAYLGEIGLRPDRVTNQKPYTQTQTEIQYRPGFEEQALVLQDAMDGRAVLALSGQMRQDIQVRLVLGKDLKSPGDLAQIKKTPPLRLAGGRAGER